MDIISLLRNQELCVEMNCEKLNISANSVCLLPGHFAYMQAAWLIGHLRCFLSLSLVQCRFFAAKKHKNAYIITF